MILLSWVLDLGVPRVNLGMFYRKKKNLSGSTSVQIISKERGKYKVVKTIGHSTNEQEIQKLIYLAKQEVERLGGQTRLFLSQTDIMVEQVFASLNNESIMLETFNSPNKFSSTTEILLFC